MSDEEKKATSYTYWVKKDDNFFNGIDVDCKPKKVEAVQEESRDKFQSAWNKSGTWEERKLDKDALKGFLQGKLTFMDGLSEPSYEVESISGEVRLSIGKHCLYWRKSEAWL